MADDATTTPGPKINKEYWFLYSKTITDNALKTRDEAAAKLQTLVTWLWGIYVAATTVGFGLAGKALSFWPKFWIAAASGALIAVYWGTVWVQIPKMVRFAPNDADGIREVYDQSVRRKNFRIHVTLFLSVVAAALVATSLIVASLAKEQKAYAPALTAAVHTDAGKRFLSLTLMVPPKTKGVTVTLKPTKSALAPSKGKELAVTPKPTQPKDSTQESPTAIYAPTAEGLVQISMPLEGLTPPLEVTLAWTDTVGLKTTLTQTVQESPTAGTKEAKDTPAKQS